MAQGKRRKAVKTRPSSQSAMEYLLTYSWALLLIAIVVAVLFELNFFSFSEKAMPGSCSVYRINGPYSLLGINLEGICKNLAPEYIMDFGSSYLSGGVTRGGNGKGQGDITYPSYVSAPAIPEMETGHGVTITAWVDWYGPSAANCQGVFGANPSPGDGIALWGYGGNNGECGPLWIDGSYDHWPGTSNAFVENQWTFVAAVYNQSTGSGTVYENDNVFSTATQYTSGFNALAPLTMGGIIVPSGVVYAFNGLVSNVQLYNSTLGPATLNAMYAEGMGGDPIQIQNLVAWWPLNGNANDYSGNENNGQAFNATSVGG